MKLLFGLFYGERSENMAHNGLQLGEVAEIEGQMLGLAQKFNRITAVEFSTKPAILPNCLLCVRHSF